MYQGSRDAAVYLPKARQFATRELQTGGVPAARGVGSLLRDTELIQIDPVLRGDDARTFTVVTFEDVKQPKNPSTLAENVGTRVRTSLAPSAGCDLDP